MAADYLVKLRCRDGRHRPVDGHGCQTDIGIADDLALPHCPRHDEDLVCVGRAVPGKCSAQAAQASAEHADGDETGRAT